MARTIRTEIVIDAPAERVWDVLADLGAYPEWNPFLVAVQGEVREGSRLTITAMATDRPFTFRPTVQDVEPNRKLRWLGHMGLRGIFDGEHIHELEPAGPERTRYVQSENFGGVLVPFMGKLLKSTERAFHRMNAALKERAEKDTDTSR